MPPFSTTTAAAPPYATRPTPHSTQHPSTQRHLRHVSHSPPLPLACCCCVALCAQVPPLSSHGDDGVSVDACRRLQRLVHRGDGCRLVGGVRALPKAQAAAAAKAAAVPRQQKSHHHPSQTQRVVRQHGRVHFGAAESTSHGSTKRTVVSAFADCGTNDGVVGVDLREPQAVQAPRQLPAQRAPGRPAPATPQQQAVQHFEGWVQLP